MKPSIGARIPRLRTAVLLTLAVCVVTTLPAATLAQDDPIEPDPQQQSQREQAMELLTLGQSPRTLPIVIRSPTCPQDRGPSILRRMSLWPVELAVI